MYERLQQNTEDFIILAMAEFYNDEPLSFQYLPNVVNRASRRGWMGGSCSTNGEKRNAYRLLVEIPEGKRPLGRPRRRWLDNIRMDLGEVGWDDVEWIGLAKDRNRWRALVNSVLNLRVP
jgi:hypothetical protein